MMTEEEKAALERQRCEGKFRCRELYATIEQLERLLKSYKDKHSVWRRRAEDADRKLAMEKRQIVPIGKSGKKQVNKASELTINLSREQIERLAEALGVSLEETNENN